MTELSYKVVSSAGDDNVFGRPAATLLGVSGKRVWAPGAAVKAASEATTFIQGITPDKNHSYIHLISMGAMEFYGPNKRGDAFNESSATYHPPKPYSKTASEVALDGGLTKYHNPTFTANGKVYREHASIIVDPRNKPLGEVVFATYNKPMHRGELIIKLSNDEWHDEIDRVASDKPIYFSMGCLTASDVCSYCGKRTSPNDKVNRCEHLRKELLMYKDDGTQVSAITDHPIFYDISHVARPADKIAFSLAKVASETGMIRCSPSPLGVMPVSFFDAAAGRRTVNRVELLVKVASEEKALPAGIELPVCLPNDQDTAIIKSIREKDVPKVLFLLRENRTLLPPSLFVQLVGGKGETVENVMPLVHEQLPKIFNNVLEDDDLRGFLEDGTYEGESTGDRQLLETLMPIIRKYSLDDEPVRRRVLHIVIAPSSKMATDRRLVTPTMMGLASDLAKEYARYELSFLTGNRDSGLTRKVLASNRAELRGRD